VQDTEKDTVQDHVNYHIQESQKENNNTTTNKSISEQEPEPKSVINEEYVPDQKTDMAPEQESASVVKRICNNPDLPFKNTFKIWVHGEIKNRTTIAESDGNFYTIRDIGSYLMFFNNIHKFNLQSYTFFISKSLMDGTYVEPLWEHPLNRDGLTCSLRIEMIYGMELLQQLCYLYVNESLVSDMRLINILSFNRVNNWMLIKFWSSYKNLDFKKLLPYNIISAYPTLCVKTTENKKSLDIYYSTHNSGSASSNN
jgi:hypothetical protein